ncbi:MAG: phenylacetate--CoA ligase [Candidatus Thermoplasmatota archaeon]|nr:phenylacetate--CoA ligase [Candidatus Thermoplasmatota archaeon]
MPMFSPEIESMRTEEIRKLQEERMIKMARYAYERIPMYKRRFQDKGITPDDIKSLDDVAKLPFTYKDDLRDHYPYGILAVPIRDVVRFHASSGTTGTPTVVSYTEHDMDVWTRNMARAYAAAGATKEDIVQNAYGYGLFTGGLGFHYGAERLGCAVVPTATGNTKRQLSMMKDFKTTVLCCTPSYATFLGEAALKEGLDPKKDFNLKIGMFGAEPWSEEQRQNIQDVLGLKAIDNYGMSELYGPGVAVECPHQTGLHVWGDEFYVETIDPDTEEVLEPGKKGEMVITMLTREAMPLLRYRTKDICIINWEECECGRSHPRIMRITGRSDDMLIVGGVNVFPSQIESVLLDTPGTGDQYQIIVDRDILDHLYVKVEVDENTWKKPDFNKDSFSKKIVENLTAVLTLRAKVELIEPGGLPRTEGKAKRVIDLRKQ